MSSGLDFLKKLCREDLLDKNQEALRNAASLGWTLPPDLPPTDFLKMFSKAQEDLQDADAYLGSYYLAHIERLFSSIETQLKFIPAYLQQLIKESIYCYKNGLLQVCVPSLFSALEGVMTFYVEDRKTTSYQKLHNNISQKDGIVFEALALKSVAYFLEQHFRNADFSKAEHTFCELNRHWALHGKYKQPLSAVSVVKLFVVLGTALMNTVMLMTEETKL